MYAGEDQFVDQTTAFLRQGADAGEPALVVVSARKIDLLRESLDGQSEGVVFADMAAVGHNPARIIPAWHDFVGAHAGSAGFRGVGEPIYPERDPDQLVECQRHESLLNLAFTGVPGFWLLCPYDTSILDRTVVEEAYRSHPFVCQGDDHTASDRCRTFEEIAAPFALPLSDPPPHATSLDFSDGRLERVRQFVSDYASAQGLSPEQTADLVVSVNEMASNSLLHGGGRGILRTWRNAETVICEIADNGHVDNPLVGRRRPGLDRVDGRGVWLANQLCDLVQLRVFPSGTVVRMHMTRQPD